MIAIFCTVVLSTDPGNGTETQEFCLLIKLGHYKKYSVLKGDLIFADKKGVPRGHPQALKLVPLGYFLG
jgi:hypothetical protein